MAWPAAVVRFDSRPILPAVARNRLPAAGTGFHAFASTPYSQAQLDAAVAAASAAAASFGSLNGLTLGQTWPRERRIVV